MQRHSTQGSDAGQAEPVALASIRKWRVEAGSVSELFEAGHGFSRRSRMPVGSLRRQVRSGQAFACPRRFRLVAGAGWCVELAQGLGWLRPGKTQSRVLPCGASGRRLGRVPGNAGRRMGETIRRAVERGTQRTTRAWGSRKSAAVVRGGYGLAFVQSRTSQTPVATPRESHSTPKDYRFPESAAGPAAGESVEAMTTPARSGSAGAGASACSASSAGSDCAASAGEMTGNSRR